MPVPVIFLACESEPKGTPAAVIARLDREIGAVLAESTIEARLAISARCRCRSMPRSSGQRVQSHVSAVAVCDHIAWAVWSLVFKTPYELTKLFSSGDPG